MQNVRLGVKWSQQNKPIIEQIYDLKPSRAKENDLNRQFNIISSI